MPLDERDESDDAPCVSFCAALVVTLPLMVDRCDAAIHSDERKETVNYC